MRVVVDTNVIVSRLLSPHGGPAQVFERGEHGAFDLVVSEAMLQEYRRSLLYQPMSVRHGLSPQEVSEAVDHLRQFATVVELGEVIDVITQDSADNRVLECAIAGEAQYIISGDAQLLGLQEFRGIQILAPRAFLSLLNQEAGPH